jgi:methylated-DNA-[protein]-cysteine S-methyltransferase
LYKTAVRCQTDFGEILAIATEDALVELRFSDTEKKGLASNILEKDEPNQILKDTCTEIQEYFAGKRKSFSVPVHPAGTDFMQDVWEALMDIPYGQTHSYGEIAKRIKRPKAFRAVGMACNKNPIPLFIPCHRVVGARGDLVGYRGGLDLKLRLLMLESCK